MVGGKSRSSSSWWWRLNVDWDVVLAAQAQEPTSSQ